MLQCEHNQATRLFSVNYAHGRLENHFLAPYRNDPDLVVFRQIAGGCLAAGAVDRTWGDYRVRHPGFAFALDGKTARPCISCWFSPIV
jgi:hypothetical protein